MERVASNVSVDQIRDMDENGQIRRNLIDAPIKDTVAVPDGGYTIIRFVATNPGSLEQSITISFFLSFSFLNLGYWLFHCHLEFHIEIGMGLIFKVGDHEELPPIPENFPTCGNWLL